MESIINGGVVAVTSPNACQYDAERFIKAVRAVFKHESGTSIDANTGRPEAFDSHG